MNAVAKDGMENRADALAQDHAANIHHRHRHDVGLRPENADKLYIASIHLIVMIINHLKGSKTKT